MGSLLPLVGATGGKLSSGKMASSRVTKKQDPPCDFPGVLLPRPPPAVARYTQFGAAEGNSRIVGSSDDKSIPAWQESASKGEDPEPLGGSLTL